MVLSNNGEGGEFNFFRVKVTVEVDDFSKEKVKAYEEYGGDVNVDMGEEASTKGNECTLALKRKFRASLTHMTIPLTEMGLFRIVLLLWKGLFPAMFAH